MDQVTAFLDAFGFSPKETVVIVAALAAGIFFWRYLVQLKKDINNRLDTIQLELKSDITTHTKSITSVEKAIAEIQTVLKTNLEYDCKQEVISAIRDMSEHHSPVVLKPEYRPFIEDTDLQQQVEDRKPELVGWLQERQPKSGLDAQNAIVDLVVSGEIKQFINRTEFDQKLYLAGKTILEANAILSLYLFEEIIPEVVSDEKTESKS